MGRFYEPPIEGQFDNPFRRDGEGRLNRASYWLDLSDRSLILVMTQGIGRDLTVAQKRAHLEDIKREHLFNEICAADETSSESET